MDVAIGMHKSLGSDRSRRYCPSPRHTRACLVTRATADPRSRGTTMLFCKLSSLPRPSKTRITCLTSRRAEAKSAADRNSQHPLKNVQQLPSLLKPRPGLELPVLPTKLHEKPHASKDVTECACAMGSYLSMRLPELKQLSVESRQRWSFNPSNRRRRRLHQPIPKQPNVLPRRRLP